MSWEAANGISYFNLGCRTLMLSDNSYNKLLIHEGDDSHAKLLVHVYLDIMDVIAIDDRENIFR